MLNPERLDALAAGFTVLAHFHRKAPDARELSDFWGLLDEWPLTGTDGAETGLGMLRESHAQGETARDIYTDHARMYGTLATARVSPYESVHRGVDGLVFDTHTLQVRDAYRSLSLQVPNLNREPDDHIGLELEFIAQSCLRALDSVENDAVNDAERYVRFGADFLRDHLLHWAPAMLHKVAEQADTRFMAGLAHLTGGAIESYTEFTGVASTGVFPTRR